MTSYTEGNSGASLSHMIVPIVTGYRGRFSSIPQVQRLPHSYQLHKGRFSCNTWSHQRLPFLVLTFLAMSSSSYWELDLTSTVPNAQDANLYHSTDLHTHHRWLCSYVKKGYGTFLSSSRYSQWAFTLEMVILFKKYIIIIKGWLLMLLLHLLYLNYRLINCLMVASEIA